MVEQQVLDLLCELSGSEEPRENREVRLFDEGLLDSLAAVELLVFLEGHDIIIPITEFDREEWATPNMIIENITK